MVLLAYKLVKKSMITSWTCYHIFPACSHIFRTCPLLHSSQAHSCMDVGLLFDYTGNSWNVLPDSCKISGISAFSSRSSWICSLCSPRPCCGTLRECKPRIFMTCVLFFCISDTQSPLNCSPRMWKILTWEMCPVRQHLKHGLELHMEWWCSWEQKLHDCFGSSSRQFLAIWPFLKHLKHLTIFPSSSP